MKINKLFAFVVALIAILFGLSGCVTKRNVEAFSGPAGSSFKDKGWSLNPFSTLGNNAVRQGGGAMPYGGQPIGQGYQPGYQGQGFQQPQQFVPTGRVSWSPTPLNGNYGYQQGQGYGY